MANKKSFPVFKDRHGNRMIFPSMYSSDDEGKSVSWFDTQPIAMATGLTVEDDPFEITPDEEGFYNFTHVVGDLGSSAFMHGRATCYMIGGPEFDSVVNEELTTPSE